MDGEGLDRDRVAELLTRLVLQLGKTVGHEEHRVSGAESVRHRS